MPRSGVPPLAAAFVHRPAAFGTAVFKAAADGRLRALKVILVLTGLREGLSANGWSAVFAVLVHADVTILTYLIQVFPECIIEPRDMHRASPVHYCNYYDRLPSLIEAMLSIDAALAGVQDEAGDTVLHGAVRRPKRYGSARIIRAVMDVYPAAVGVWNHKGVTPLQEAENQKDFSPELMGLLQRRGPLRRLGASSSSKSAAATKSSGGGAPGLHNKGNPVGDPQRAAGGSKDVSKSRRSDGGGGGSVPRR